MIFPSFLNTPYKNHREVKVGCLLKEGKEVRLFLSLFYQKELEYILWQSKKINWKQKNEIIKRLKDQKVEKKNIHTYKNIWKFLGHVFRCC